MIINAAKMTDFVGVAKELKITGLVVVLNVTKMLLWSMWSK